MKTKQKIVESLSRDVSSVFELREGCVGVWGLGDWGLKLQKFCLLLYSVYSTSTQSLNFIHPFHSITSNLAAVLQFNSINSHYNCLDVFLCHVFHSLAFLVRLIRSTCCPSQFKSQRHKSLPQMIGRQYSLLMTSLFLGIIFDLRTVHGNYNNNITPII